MVKISPPSAARGQFAELARESSNRQKKFSRRIWGMELVLFPAMRGSPTTMARICAGKGDVKTIPIEDELK